MFKCYIPVGGDTHLTKMAIDSLIPELKNYPGSKIVLINNTEKPLPIEPTSDIIIMDSPVRLLHGQSINWMIRMAYQEGYPFCMSLHNDAKVFPGAIKEIIDYWETVKDTKWGAIKLGKNNGDALVLWNPKFNYEENVWHNPLLFPMYYMDNHYYRIMELRGWKIHNTEHDLLFHEGSHTIRHDKVANRVNQICFKYHGAIYNEIWLGLPGYEKSNDKYASGTVPKKNNI